MPRIPEISVEEASSEIQKLYATSESMMQMVPNVYKAMAHSPAVLSTFMHMQEALQTGVLGARFQQQIAVLSAQCNLSTYCLAVNTAVGKAVGLSEEQLLAARSAFATDAKVDVGLKFVKSVIENRGTVADDEFDKLLEAGFSYEEISEIMGNIGFNLFANYFNLVSKSNPDFPLVDLDFKAARTTI